MEELELPMLKPGARVWVAFSGGLDSTVLLHQLHAHGVANLRAVHVHHGLQAAADDWVRHARRVCRALNVPLSVKRVVVEPRSGDGPEAAARAARHAAFAALLRDDDLLATAHHRDDQAETVLLRALRGTGIAGLAAMTALAPCGRGRLWRPLLDRSRAELAAYAREHQLTWIDDPHNADPRYARSYLRREIMPRLAAHWPQADASLARLAERAGEAAALLAELAEQDLQAARCGEGWSVAALLGLSAPRRRNALYQLWLAQDWPAPAAQTLAQVEREVLGARGDAQPLLAHEAGQIRRFRDTLFLMPVLPPPPTAALRWPARRRALVLPAGLGVLQASRVPPVPLEVRFARGGETLRPAGDAHSRSLKNLCQSRGLPLWVRQRMPLVYALEAAGAELIAVAGYWRNARAAALELDFTWQTELPGAAGQAPGTAAAH